MRFLPNNFNPIAFLEIEHESLKDEEKNELEKVLTQSLIEYVLIKLTNRLTENQMKTFVTKESPQQKLKTLERFIPNLDEVINQELENFKKEYKNV